MSKKRQKLVRDNIPAIIEADGKKAVTRILEDKEYLEELIKKLHEELEEFSETPNIEEMADIYEVLIGLKNVMNISDLELEEVRSKKAEKNGAFEKRIYLEGVE